MAKKKEKKEEIKEIPEIKNWFNKHGRKTSKVVVIEPTI
jgi:hypothetical protein